MAVLLQALVIEGTNSSSANISNRSSTSSSSKAGPINLHRALLDLCHLTKHRLDSLHLSKLESALKGAQAAAFSATDTTRTAGLTAGRRSSSGSCSSSHDGSGGSTRSSSTTFNSSSSGAPPPTTPSALRTASRLKAPEGGACSSGSATAAAAAMQLGATTPGTARKPGRSRLAGMSTQKGPQPITPAAATAAAGRLAGDADGAELAGMFASRLMLAEAGPAGGKAGRHRQEGGEAACAPPIPRKAGGRRVCFSEDCAHAESSAAGSGEGPGGGSVAVPPSVARHAVPRDLQCSSMLVVGSLRGEARASVKAAAAPAAGQGRSRLSRAAAAVSQSSGAGSADASGAREEEGGAAAWRPAVVLLLGSPLHQLPWESCPGLTEQHVFRWAPTFLSHLGVFSCELQGSQ